VKHTAGKEFWDYYNQSGIDTEVSLRKFRPAQERSAPSLILLQKVGRFWSVRIGLHYRAVAVHDGTNFGWFWIGHHSEYDRLISG
jgi:hypothetical protein